jgi:acyl carrier protein
VKPHQFKTISVDFDPFREGELLLTAPRTEAQEEIWLAAQRGDEANCAFNESIWMRLRGHLDVEAIRAAFQQLMARHDALRTVLSPDGETLCILPPPAGSMPCTDLSHMEPQEQKQQLDRMLRQEVTTPFDLVRGPLFRAQMVKLRAEEHCVMITAHHIICDGWSWGILLPDFVALYAACQQGMAARLPAAESFSEYARAHSQQVTAPDAMRAQQYWLQELSGGVPALDLPTDRPRPLLKTYNAAREDYRLRAPLVTGLRRLGAEHGCTLFTTLLAGFTVFLHRITQQQDVLVGITAAGQLASGKHHLVGHCVNVLPLRTSIDGKRCFTDYLPALHRTLLDAYEHQQVTFSRLLKNMVIPRDPSRMPLIPVRFNLARDIGERSILVHGVEFEMFTNPRCFENFEIFLDAMEREGALSLECYYNTHLFQAQTIRRRLEEFEVLLEGIVANPEQAIAAFPLLPEAEQQLLQAWHSTQTQLPPEIDFPADAEVYILDKHLQTVPIGVPGELYMGSAALDQDRFSSQDVTAIANRPNQAPGQRLYKTGYLGRYGSNGDIQVLGRTENRLPIRGFRVSLEEIEATLEQHAAVRQAAVVAGENSTGEKCLTAYVVPSQDRSEPELDARLQSFLRERLPRYMIPTGLVTIKDMPLSAGGDIDRFALARMAVVKPPTLTPDALENELIDIWKQFLHLTRINLHDNFFELGGNSCLVVLLSREIEKKYGRRLPLVTFFQAATIKQLADIIRAR